MFVTNIRQEDENLNNAMDECDGGSHYKDSQSSGAEEHFIESDERKAQLLAKIERVKDKLKAANKCQEADVDEFLKVNSNFVSTSVENPQLIRIRQTFEKKNKKSAQLIQALQKKLEHYQQLLKCLDAGGPTPPARRLRHDNVLSSVGQGLKDVGANIKESLTGYTGTVISVPKDLAIRLLKRSGSADNIHRFSTKNDLDVVKLKSSTVGSYPGKVSRPQQQGRSIFYANLLDRSRAGSDSFYSPNTVPNRLADLGSDSRPNSPRQRHLTAQDVPARHYSPNGEHFIIDQNASEYGDQNIYCDERHHRHPSQQKGPLLSVVGSHHETSSRLDSSYDHQQIAIAVDLQNQVKKMREDMEKCRDEISNVHRVMDDWKIQAQQEYAYLRNTLNEEKYKSQRLEDQLNDQAELHQAEMNNLRLEARNLEGRLFYQVNSRVEDIQDECGKLSNEISGLKERMKDIKQFVGMEGFEGLTMNAKLKRGSLVVFQFMADFLLVVVSLLNRRHVKASLMVLILALMIYNAGGYLVWNFLSFIFRLIFFKSEKSSPFHDHQQQSQHESNDSSSPSLTTANLDGKPDGVAQ